MPRSKMSDAFEELECLDGVDRRVITKEMEEEEKKLEEANEMEMESLRRKYEAEEHKKEMRERGYKSLMELLSRSQLYAKYLQHKLEESSKQNDDKRRKKVQLGKLDSEKVMNLKSKATSVLSEKNQQGLKSGNKKKEGNDKKPNGVDSGGMKTTSLGIKVPVEQPDLLEGVCLRDYQLHGFNWLKLLFEGGLNGILADEMGLGKTVQTIAFLAHLYEKGVTGPFLVIGPLSTLPNWIYEFEQFAPQLPVLLYHGNLVERKQLRRKIVVTTKLMGRQVYPVIVTSYQIPWLDVSFMSKLCWKALIVDEGHVLKNHNSLLHRVLSTFRTTHRLLLTGTPLQNRMSELWSLLHFLLPEIFDTLSAFETWFQIEEWEKGQTTEDVLKLEKENNILTHFHNILSPFMLRRMKADVNLILPPKKEVIIYCPLTNIQRSMYKYAVEKLIAKLTMIDESKLSLDKNIDGIATRSMYKEVQAKRQRLNTRHEEKCEPPTIEFDHSSLSKTDIEWGQSIVYKMEKKAQLWVLLRKVVNHLYLIKSPFEFRGDLEQEEVEHIITSSGKTLILDQLLTRLKARNHKVLLFSTWITCLDILEDIMQIRGYKYERLDGRTQLEVRKEMINRFNTDPSIFIFLISTRAGGLGINLVAADTVVLFDSDWNPQVDNQAQDRCHRIGQTRPVMVYRLISTGTYDEKIINRAQSRRKLEKIVLHKGIFKHCSAKEKQELMTLEELKSLLESKQHNCEIHSNGSVLTDEQWSLLLDRSKMVQEYEEV